MNFCFLHGGNEILLRFLHGGNEDLLRFLHGGNETEFRFHGEKKPKKKRKIITGRIFDGGRRRRLIIIAEKGKNLSSTSCNDFSSINQYRNQIRVSRSSERGGEGGGQE